ncbi:MAG: hypothetical protein EXQ56_04130 [Acidobacteria bacterium]|nr:hypothetical protein [Acidobacteriota bacterium]
MLNIFRRRDLLIRILSGAFLVAVCLSMVITLIPGMTGSTVDPTVGKVVAEVGSEEITSTELQAGVMNLTRSARIPAEMVWNYSTQVLDELVLEKATLQEAERLGIHITEAKLQDRLRQIPDLFPQGKFVGKEQYENLVFERMGTSPAEFERRFRNSLVTEQFRKLVTDSISVSPEEIRKEVVAENETFVLSYAYIDPETVKKEIATPDPLVETYFGQNKSSYQVGEKRIGKVLLLDRAAVEKSVVISDADIRKYYQDRIDSYRTEERVAVSHILIKADGKDKAVLEAARKKSEDLAKQLLAGADFAALATKNSEDAGSAVKGGDLGYITRGQTVPGFEQMTFGLEPGAVSSPVQTEFGFHLIKVREHQQAHLRTVDEVRGEIQAALMTERVQTALTTKGEQAAVEWRKNIADARSIATKYEATVIDIPGALRTEMVPGVAGSGPVMQELFSIEKGWVGRPIPVGTGVAVPLNVEIQPARPAQFSEVKERVRADYLNQQARSLALIQAQGLAQALEKQEKKDIATAAKGLKLTVKTSPAVSRTGSIDGVGSLGILMPSLKTLKQGEVAGPIVAGAGQIVYQLASRSTPPEAVLALQQKNVEQRLRVEKQNLAFNAFQESLKKRLTDSGDLVIHQDVLSQMGTPLGAPPVPMP